MDRRAALKSLALTGLAAATASSLRSQSGPAVPPAPAAAPVQPPPTKPVQPGTWSFKVGEFECIALNDGISRMQPIQPTWAPEASAVQVTEVLRNHFLPTDRLHVAFNALLVRTPKGNYLLDTGSGARARARNNGWLGAHLETLGIAPEAIDGVFLSHAHGDHHGGLLDADGKPVFPKARLFVSAAERDFWMAESPDFSKSRAAPANLANAVAAARRVFETLKPVTETLKDGDSFAEGLQLVSAHGHTAGHSFTRIRSGSEELLFLADLAHHPALMFDNPRWTVLFDVNPGAAAETRAGWFERLAAMRSRVHLFHMPFPGVGHIRRTGEGSFAWVPEPWTVLPTS
jgi:glyoxylase-like metal-dependent hydrolase (beta-lactamase superfamily II)